MFYLKFKNFKNNQNNNKKIFQQYNNHYLYLKNNHKNNLNNNHKNNKKYILLYKLCDRKDFDAGTRGFPFSNCPPVLLTLSVCREPLLH